jgi:hypothetical protein
MKETPVQTAKRMARYGHRDWLIWTPDGQETKSAKLSSGSIKQCLLEMGTKGRFSVISASTAISFRHGWRTGINILNQFKYGDRI